MTREVQIEIVCKQSFELQAYQSTFGDDGAMLFLDAEEVFVGTTVGEYHCLATQGTYLGSANIKHIAMTSQIGHCDITAVSHQTIAQTGPVNI